MCVCMCCVCVCVCEHDYFSTQDGECHQEVGRVMTAAIQYDERKKADLLHLDISLSFKPSPEIFALLMLWKKTIPIKDTIVITACTVTLLESLHAWSQSILRLVVFLFCSVLSKRQIMFLLLLLVALIAASTEEFEGKTICLGFAACQSVKYSHSEFKTWLKTFLFEQAFSQT